MITEKTLVTRLRKALNETTESQIEIAQYVGVSRQQLWKFKKGINYSMKGIRLMKMAERLGVDTES